MYDCQEKTTVAIALQIKMKGVYMMLGEFSNGHKRKLCIVKDAEGNTHKVIHGYGLYFTRYLLKRKMSPIDHLIFCYMAHAHFSTLQAQCHIAN